MYIIKKNNVEKIFNNEESYKEKQQKAMNEDLFFFQKEAACLVVDDYEKLCQLTSSIYNRRTGMKIMASMLRRKKRYKILEDWSAKIVRESINENDDYLTIKGKLMNQFFKQEFHQCENNVLYIVPEAMITDERPHDFFIFEKSRNKYLSIEIQDLTHFEKKKVHKDNYKGQYITFNPPGPQFSPVRISGWQITEENNPEVIEKMLDWFYSDTGLFFNYPSYQSLDNNCRKILDL